MGSNSLKTKSSISLCKIQFNCAWGQDTQNGVGFSSLGFTEDKFAKGYKVEKYQLQLEKILSCKMLKLMLQLGACSGHKSFPKASAFTCSQRRHTG